MRAGEREDEVHASHECSMASLVGMAASPFGSTPVLMLRAQEKTHVRNSTSAGRFPTLQHFKREDVKDQ